MTALLLAALLAANIRLENGVFKVAGGQAGELTVSVDKPKAPPMLGTMKVTGGEATFTPRFPLVPGVTYRAVWQPVAGAPVSATFAIPKLPPLPAAFVETIYPTSDKLPENQLKFYIHFSASMSRGEAARRIQLIGEDGTAARLPFLLLDEELWDPDGKRLTLFFDPGRVKRGLVPHNESGTAIVAGRKYTLLIDGGWPDATGQTLRSEYRKEFVGVAADRSSPDPETWRVIAPRAATRDPLIIQFPEPMDHALLMRMIGVDGVDGAVEVGDREMRWSFTPDQPWRAGTGRISINGALEDLAGNRMGRLFDADMSAGAPRVQEAKSVTMPFEIR